MKHRFHIIGYVHLPTSRYYSSCAFTQKAINLAKMLVDNGHTVFYYGARSERHDNIEDYIKSPRLHFKETHTLTDIRKDYGEGDNRFEIGYNWRETQFKNDFNAERKPSTLKFYQKCNDYILKNRKPDDFILLMQGYYHKPIADAVNLYLTCEPGIGYRGSYAKFRAFESRYIQYFTYGGENPRNDINGNYYDRVIPNYFNPEHFEVAKKKKDYYLYIGRLIQRKGVWTAVRATQAIGARLVIAGQPDPEINLSQLPTNCEYVGQVGWDDRKSLMSEAIATFVPTEYLEPFGGVAVESLLSGTPILTTNFGAFTDYNIDGVTGYKCDTLQDFIDGTEKVKKLSPKTIREHGMQFSLKEVSKQYEKWWKDLYQLYRSATIKGEKGWNHYEIKNKR